MAHQVAGPAVERRHDVPRTQGGLPRVVELPDWQGVNINDKHIETIARDDRRH